MIKIYSIAGATIFDTILIHPDNLPNLISLCDRLDREINKRETCFSQMPYYNSTFMGLKVKEDKHVPKFGHKYEFPRTPFIEYEEKDILWAQKIGFGHWVDSEERICYCMKERGYEFRPIHMYS